MNEIIKDMILSGLMAHMMSSCCMGKNLHGMKGGRQRDRVCV